MGLFDRKSPDITPTPRPVEPAPPREPAPEPELAREPVSASASASAAQQAGYGIQNAIELMRKLPAENVELVVAVVKTTLESLDVDIAAIIEDAERKHARINTRMAKLEAEISEYEEEIAARREEIAAITSDREETNTVKERLEQAHRGGLSSARSGTVSPQSRPSQASRPASAFTHAPERPPLADHSEAD